ncbi:hypothetical protein GCM10027289_27030 [Tsukamurella serpentis]
MTDCVIEPDTVRAHASALERIAGTVEQASSAASTRIGAMDYGALFADWLVPLVNGAIDRLDESVRRHGTELQTHRAEFARNIAVNRAADGGAGAALSQTVRP